MMRKLSLLFAGALMGASAMSLVYGAPGSAANAAGSETYKQLAIFGDIFERVRAQYVTPPDDKSLVENAINGMLSSLDPHSSYMNAEQAQDMRVQTKGEFGGLGIEVTMENDLVKVITPIDDTPAAKAGVLAGDYIAKIDGEEVRGLTLNDAVDKMRGLVNTPIKLTILRQGADKPIELTVVRDIIKVKAVKFRVENDIGYMKITSFTEKTYDDLENAIETIKKQVPDDKLKGYVLDLRLNPGGLLDQAVSVSDAFLKRGEIVSTRGRDPKDVTRFDAKPKQTDDINGKPMIVLVNGGSASASEIVAGALQDLRRVTVVGTQSFGKGSVQTIIPLGENGALRLTTALYYTPSGKSIQGKGITPDIKVDQPLPPELQGRDLTRGESDLKGHIKGADESKTGSGSAAYVPPDPKDDLQLIYAEQLLRGQKTDPAFPPNPEKAVLNQ
ncbi:S41 family peptidase [Mesorhizobium australicum]|uniref:S41 family peptidase n=2 Tax=Mesorhizobium australicum TaxID=536018 RepID=A0ACC6SYK5_9HYPH|nr:MULTISPECIES: S41 family peptidase [Mesorhizobium]MBZ9930111.1 S41 family peptidase [Mesorhizobium sp. BR1-1-5]AGB43730.1 C-terminal processing peptidase [Mesorhizobium australicum WSM2073]ESY82719.1 peptidase S41 [Mesorhizobium sp. LNHC220B00]ESY94107.1 peptidase S41 [Mesorhizobium sp. LNHC229A00]ESY98314.1 peptidase S41 [Mesorhizobium sp. LNHC209A00]